MSFLIDVLALALAFSVGYLIRRYFILTSGEEKTNMKFIPSFNLIFGSNDIVFCHDKVLAVNADDRHEELGDTFGCYFGESMQLFTRDPELVYKVCVNEFQKHQNRWEVESLSPYMKASLLEARDQAWQASRRAVGSVLKASKLKMDNVETNLDVTISEMLSSIDRRLKEAKARGDEPIIDCHQVNKNFIMQSILKIIYNTDKLVNFDNEYNEVVEEMYNFISVNYEYIPRLCFLLPPLRHIVRPLLGFLSHGKYLDSLTNKLDTIIKTTLLANRENVPTDRLTTIHSLIKSYSKGELSRDQLMGNAVFLMLAGFATSVDTMTVFLWELANHQDVQDKLRSDLLQYGEESKYLEQCLNETLRLYPGAITDRDLGDHVYHKGFRLVKGSILNINIYSIHRNPKYWGKDAAIWNPERFDSNEVKKFHPAQYIPFGIGPRNCVGYHLARLELKKFTVQFLLKYKVEPCEMTPSKIQLTPLGALPFALPIQGNMLLKLSPATIY